MLIAVVVIDPAVIEASRDYFGLPLDDRLHAVAQDGRLYLDRTSATYEVILVDAFLKDYGPPFHLVTREFYELVRSRLAPAGVLAANVIGALEGPDSRLFRAVIKTMQDVFPTVYVFPVD